LQIAIIIFTCDLVLYQKKKPLSHTSGFIQVYWFGYNLNSDSFCAGFNSITFRISFALASASSTVWHNPRASKVPAATVPVLPFPPPQ
jgi:hypothetical protein